jgi:hypothetical protein
MGRSGQPVQNPAGRIGKRPASACTLSRARAAPCARLRASAGPSRNRTASRTPGAHSAQERLDAALENLAGVFARARQHLLADHLGLELRLMQHHVEVLLDVLRLTLLDHQHGALAGAEAHDLLVDQRIGDVEHIERQLGAAEAIGQPQQLERPHQRVVQAALHDDPDVARANRP